MGKQIAKRVDPETYDAKVADLRVALLDAQYRVLAARKGPPIVVIGGVDGAGKGETVNVLLEWLDPRHVEAHAVGEPTDEERQRPPMWRFWRRLPAAGKLGIFFGSWYTAPIVGRVLGDVGKRAFGASLEEIRRFEAMLVAEGAVVRKFWFHLSKKAQRTRLDLLSSDRRTRWRVTPEDWRRFALYDDFRAASARAIRTTSTDASPWLIVDGGDERGRNLAVGEALLGAFRSLLVDEAPKAPKERARKGKEAAPPKLEAAVAPDAPIDDLLGRVDLGAKLTKQEYAEALPMAQGRLARLTRKRRFSGISPILVFEGADAAGKGGAIRRVTQAIDARIYDVVTIAAPSDEERAHPYLWRFWRHAPRDGKFVIFDRSWYGRVLVERVEGFAREADWRRAYDEIVDFESQLARAGCPIVKVWLQISPEEQLKRFREREATPWKNFKIGPEDWRNREKWSAYQAAANEMFARTSTPHAPWTIVEAEDKYHARVKVLETISSAIERALD
jgi:polyphosphate:AMP phosphotransferase